MRSERDGAIALYARKYPCSWRMIENVVFFPFRIRMKWGYRVWCGTEKSGRGKAAIYVWMYVKRENENCVKLDEFPDPKYILMCVCLSSYVYIVLYTYHHPAFVVYLTYIHPSVCGRLIADWDLEEGGGDVEGYSFSYCLMLFIHIHSTSAFFFINRLFFIRFLFLAQTERISREWEL